MDPQSEALLQVLRQSVAVIEQARTEQGWTAGAVALVLVICIIGLAWMVRRLCVQVDEFGVWRNAVLQGQVESTTRALDATSTGLGRFGEQLEDATKAVQDNTRAVHGLREAVQAAPCGVRMV